MIPLFSSLTGWQKYDNSIASVNGPRLLKATLMVEEDNPLDTFFDFDCSPECTKWKHGAFFVNGFNMGRYHQAGPQKSLYIPGPFLQKGANEVHIINSKYYTA